MAGILQSFRAGGIGWHFPWTGRRLSSDQGQRRARTCAQRVVGSFGNLCLSCL